MCSCLLALLLLLAGCTIQRTLLDDSAADTLGTAEQELDFWDELATRRVVTNNDALHGLLLLEGAADVTEGYAGRLELAHQRGWLSAGAAPPANESATVGLVSTAVCDILDIEGGLLMRLVGGTPRYCTREVVYLGIVPDRTENQSLSGLEFVDLVRRAAELKPEPAPALEGRAGDGR